MSDAGVALEIVEVIGIKDLRNQPHVLDYIKMAFVKGYDAGTFLAAVLEGVKSEVGQLRRIGHIPASKYTAFVLHLPTPIRSINSENR